MSDTSEKLQSLQSNSESQLQSDSQTQKQNALWHFFGSLNPIRVIAGLSISFTGIGFAFGYSKIARLRVQKSDIRNQKMKSEEILSPVSRNPIRTALKALSIGTFFAVSGTILVTSGIIFAFGPERIKRALPNLRETKEDSESDFWDVFGLYERSDTNSKKEKKEESNN